MAEKGSVPALKRLEDGNSFNETIRKKRIKSSSSNEPKETEKKEETMYSSDEEMMDVAGLAEREFTTTEEKRTSKRDDIGIINPAANLFLCIREIVEAYSPELMSKEQEDASQEAVYRKPLNRVWDGLDAALIASKRGKDQSLMVEDNPMASHDAFWSVASQRRVDIEKLDMIVRAVGTLTAEGMLFADIHLVDLLISQEARELLLERMCSSIAKFILSIFDLEDFERVIYMDDIDDMCEDFYWDLRESCGDPLIAVAEGSFNFPLLKEHDIWDMIKQYQLFKKDGFGHEVPRFRFSFDTKSDKLNEMAIESAKRMIEEYVPLKDEYKVQLTLELTHGKSYHVLDTLLLEAWKAIGIEDFIKLFDEQSVSSEMDEELKSILEEWHGGDRRDLLKSTLSYCSTHMFCAPLRLVSLKTKMLKAFQEAVTFPLSFDAFGPCTNEVIEVVRIADHERRMQGQDFISGEHILFALSLSRVGGCLKWILKDEGLRCLGGLPSKFPMFGVYKLSRDAARILGEERVGIEHLVLAVVFGKQEKVELEEHTSLVLDDKAWNAEILERLKKSSGTKWGVESFEDTNDVLAKIVQAKWHEGEIVHKGDIWIMERLADAFKSGLKLAAIRHEEEN